MGKNKRFRTAYKVGFLISLLCISLLLTSCSLFDTMSFGGSLRIPNILVYAAVFGGIIMMLRKKK